MVTKILDFIHKDLNYKVLKSFFDHPDRFFRNLAEIDEKLYMLSVINSTEIDALWNSSALKFIEMVEIANYLNHICWSEISKTIAFLVNKNNFKIKV